MSMSRPVFPPADFVNWQTCTFNQKVQAYVAFTKKFYGQAYGQHTQYLLQVDKDIADIFFRGWEKGQACA